MIKASVRPYRELSSLYLVAEENEDVPRALVEEAVDLICWEGQELCQFPHELYHTELIQRNLLIKACGVGAAQGWVSGWGAQDTRGTRGHGDSLMVGLGERE